MGSSNASPSSWYSWIKFAYGTAVGGSTTPIYLTSSGIPTACTSYAKAIKSITRNGTTFTYTCIDETTGTFDIPSVGNGTVTIKQAGTTKGSFTMNQSGNTTIELTDNNTNTWRDIEDVLTSTSTSNSLTANMGRVLANGASDRPIVLLAGTLYRSGASSSYTTRYFTGYRHRSISSTNPTIYVSGGVARLYFTNVS